MAKRSVTPFEAIIYHQSFRKYFAQILLVLIVVGAAWYLMHNTMANLAARHIRTGYGFLTSSSTVPIAESFIHYIDGESSYLAAILVGTLNTLHVSFLSIILCLVLGLIIGIARLSRNPLINKLAMVYVEALRNVPLVLQLLVWYGFLSITLPDPSQSLQFGSGMFLNNRGLRFPTPYLNLTFLGLVIGIVAACVGLIAFRRWKYFLLLRHGYDMDGLVPSLLMIVLFPLAGVGCADVVASLFNLNLGLNFDWPKLEAIDFSGGGTLTPEFTAMWLGLGTYTSAYVAEAVRAGILSVPNGQVEAARALGLSSGRIMRLVILPQALRVIIPPALNQFLNLIKNSSLAVVIGYPELVSVNNSILNHTGQAIECISVMMLIYLIISLSVSALVNWYNHRHRMMGR